MPRLCRHENPWVLSEEGESTKRSGTAGANVEVLMVVLSIRLFGFLLGSFLSGGAAYSYLLKEYKVANDLLTEDIYVCISRATQEHLATKETRCSSFIFQLTNKMVTDSAGLRYPPQQLRSELGGKDSGQEMKNGIVRENCTKV